MKLLDLKPSGIHNHKIIDSIPFIKDNFGDEERIIELKDQDKLVLTLREKTLEYNRLLSIEDFIKICNELGLFSYRITNRVTDLELEYTLLEE